MKNILICANPDLNYIDGSSIWLQTIALLLADADNTKVDFLAKSSVERLELFEPIIAHSNINVIDGSEPNYWQGKKQRRLSFEQMGELANRLDQKRHYDVIVVRGFDIAVKLAETKDCLGKAWIYLTDIPQRLNEITDTQKEHLERIGLGCAKILCQTNEFAALWKSIVPDIEPNKLVVYSPVIPDFDVKTQLSVDQRKQRAIYAGKFKKEWMTLEMANSWGEIYSKYPGAELMMIGDKIHNEVEPKNYACLMKEALEGTEGLVWKGAMSRRDVQSELMKARVGLSWRDETLDDCIEYSTKLLEYGGAGCAAIINRNPLHERLLGKDYPLFANSKQEFVDVLSKSLIDDDAVVKAISRLKNLAQQHTFSERLNTINNWLADTPKAPKRKGKKVVLVAGHDLKFFSLLQKKLEATGEFTFIEDKWAGHNKHSINKSQELLRQADIVFCEWCLGNVQWYSHNKLPHQKLVARFHAQESKLPYLGESCWQNIDQLVFVSEHTRTSALARHSFPIEKTSVIPNFIDADKFNPLKKTGEAQFTLGLLGAAPKSKRLDRAVDLLEQLLKVDERYCLRVKGKNPLDYDWLLKRQDELAYYSEVFYRINSSPKLRSRVIFDPPGDDVNDWFTMVGFILSPSDFESFHMAVGEGMLTGAYPVIWPWEGASEIWGEEYVVKSTSDAVSKVLNRDDKSRLNIAHSPHAVTSSWFELIS